jgi:hypothetical protein
MLTVCSVSKGLAIYPFIYSLQGTLIQESVTEGDKAATNLTTSYSGAYVSR